LHLHIRQCPNPRNGHTRKCSCTPSVQHLLTKMGDLRRLHIIAGRSLGSTVITVSFETPIFVSTDALALVTHSPFVWDVLAHLVDTEVRTKRQYDYGQPATARTGEWNCLL
jgi:hypothetical protein